MTAGQATPPPPPLPQPGPVTNRFSKAKAFGLKMFLKYKPTEEFDEEDGDVTGIKVQVWVEGKCDSFRTAAAALERWRGPARLILLSDGVSRSRAEVGSG